MAWWDFIKAIRQDDEEEQRRQQEGGARNRVFGFLDDTLDVAGDVGRFGVERGKDAVGVAAGLGRGIVVRPAVTAIKSIEEEQQDNKKANQLAQIEQLRAMSPDDREEFIKNDPMLSRSFKDGKLEFTSTSAPWLFGDIFKEKETMATVDIKDDKALDGLKGKIEASDTSNDSMAVPEDRVAREILGNEPIETYQSRKKGLEGAWGDELGVAAPFAAGVGTAANVVLDVPGPQSLFKSVGKETVEQVVKTGSREGIETLLKGKVADDVIKKIAEPLAEATDSKVVKQIFDAADPSLIKKGVGKVFGKDVVQSSVDNIAKRNGLSMADEFVAAANPEKTLDEVIPPPGTRPGAEVQTAIETALNSGDTARAQQLVDGIDDINLKNGMQSTLDNLSVGPRATQTRVDPLTKKIITEPVGGAMPPTGPLIKAGDAQFGENADQLLGLFKTSSEIDKAKDVSEFGGRGARAYQQLFDKLSPMNKLVKKYETTTGRKLSTEENPYELMRLYAGMPGQIKQRLETVTGALEDGGNVNAIRVLGTARRILGRPDIAGTITPEQAKAAITEVQQKLGPEAYQKATQAVDEIVGFNEDLLRELADAGVFTKDGVEELITRNPDYFARFQVVNKLLEKTGSTQFKAGQSFNLAKQDVIKAMKGMDADSELLDPIESIVKSTDLAMRTIQKNRIWQSLDDLADDMPEMIVRVRDPENVAERMALSADNKVMRPIRNKLDRVIKTRGKTVNRLQTQINQLEKKGLDIALKPTQGRAFKTTADKISMGSDVLGTKIDPGEVLSYKNLIEEGKKIDPLVVTREKGKIFLQDGKHRLQAYKELGIKDIPVVEKTPSKALPKFTPAGMGGKVPTSQAGKAVAVTDGEDALMKSIDGESAINPSKMGPKDTETFLRNLIEGPNKEIQRLKKMVGNRDKNLTRLLDEVQVLKGEYDDIAGQVKSNTDRIVTDLKDLDAPDGYELVSGFRNGTGGKLAIPKEIADVYRGMTPSQMNYITKIVSNVNRVMKEAVTSLSLPFAFIRNPIRDFKAMASNSQNIPAGVHSIAKAWTKGFASAIKHDEMYDRWIKSGGGGAGIYGNLDDAEKIAKDLTRKVNGATIKTPKDLLSEGTRLLTTPLRAASGAVQKAGATLEAAPRLAEFQAAVGKGASDESAALASRNVTVDFSQSGTLGQLMNQWVPFLNARMQGNKKLLEAAKRNPARFAGVYTTLTAAPILGTAYLNSRFPEVVDQIDQNTKDNNFVLVLGDEKDDESNFTQVLKIPKGDMDKIFGNPLENFANFLAKNDSKGLQQVVTEMIGSALPIDVVKDGGFNVSRAVGSLLPVAAKVPVELATNKNLYFDAPVVPGSLENLPDEMQVKDDTSSAAKFLSSVFGTSPIKTEQAIRSSTGQLLTANPAEELGKTVRGASDNETSNEFYRILEATSRERAGASKRINDAIASGNMDEAKKIAEEYNSLALKKFVPWYQRYGKYAEKDLLESMEEIPINLSSRSVDQRKRYLLEKASR